MIRISVFDPLYVECWAWQQAFRKLGFPSENIFVSINRNGAIPDSPPWVFVLLRAQGLEFTVPAGPFDVTEQEFAAKWTEFCDAFNAGKIDESDLMAEYNERMADKHVLLVESMVRKGFRIPGHRSN
jgi:hypothetical protein